MKKATRTKIATLACAISAIASFILPINAAQAVTQTVTVSCDGTKNPGGVATQFLTVARGDVITFNTASSSNNSGNNTCDTFLNIVTPGLFNPNLANFTALAENYGDLNGP